MSALVKYTVADFSDHLFWDFDRNKISLDQPQGQVVQRVLEYGLLQDWIVLTHLYPFQNILQTAMQLRTLDPRALAFLINISGASKEDFRCYTNRRS
ncbi:MAG: hypothetical protein U1C70_02770 [Sediminibacterium sp.]|jgi:hypothetical protein|uniref:DUF6922 domain-containing protein n=1 Tax=Sediminibacterium sp. TaxID=1917865 RepID=UPI002AB9F7BA|nr:hypothetical protein [Sediminibacterium sp.]